MNENNLTKSSDKTVFQSVSTTILLKTNSRSKTPISNCSTGRTTIHQKKQTSHYKLLSNRHYSRNSDMSFNPVKKQLNHSVILNNSSNKVFKKTRNKNNNHHHQHYDNQVAFLRCVPKSDANIFKSTAIPISHIGSEAASDMLKLFSEYFPKDKIYDIYSENSKFIRLKIFPIVSSSKKKIMNHIPNDLNIHKIKTPEEYLKCAYNPVLKIQKRIQVKHLSAIARELSVNYSKDFSLCKKENFSERYRLYPRVLNLNNDSIDKEILSKINYKKNKLNMEIKKVLRIRNSNDTRNNKKNTLERFKTVMIKAAMHFKKLNIQLTEFYLRASDLIKPINVQSSDQLLNAIKMKRIKEIYKLIQEKAYLIHACDNFRQTPLHWAAKRNVYQVISYMVRKGAFVNFRDQVGRTPLHVAVQMENIESVQFLLYELANPLIKTNEGFLPIDFTINSAMKFILQRSSLLHTFRKLGKVSDFEKGIQAGLYFLFNDELKTNFNILKDDMITICNE